MEIKDAKGRTHQYRWKNKVPLHGQADAVEVNYFEYKIINEKGKETSTNSWVTDVKINKKILLKWLRLVDADGK
ncbi:MAG: hypothetical protein Q9M92_13475 [Enterobacterales bacterium]|nr:hypothetical protein [Enterobacterales bacterium]